MGPSGRAGEKAEDQGALEDVISANGKCSNKYEKLPSGEVGKWSNCIHSDVREIISPLYSSFFPPLMMRFSLRREWSERHVASLNAANGKKNT